MKRKKLPLGVQSFPEMIEEGYIYVDKTKDILSLLETGSYFFLSRPRRFGKSLLLSTLQELFSGNRKLFKNLYIHDKIEWKKHPAIKIDFNSLDLSTPESLINSLTYQLKEIAESHDLQITAPTLPTFFTSLIMDLCKKFGEKVVVLIDEYDKPIISHLGKGEKRLLTAESNREIMKQFYGVLKSQQVSGLLRFVFLTGVSKFSRVSIFSDLNNLNDITMNPKYGALLGYTQEELEYYFKDTVMELTQKLGKELPETYSLLRDWYNGYQFTEGAVKVYNPFSILSVFVNEQFKNYWFETGTPTFLLNLIEENEYPLPEIEKLVLPEEAFSTYEIEYLQLEALLFQTGYITIKNYDGIMYTLGFPNKEVKTSFSSYLYQHLCKVKHPGTKNRYKMLPVYLRRGELDTFIETTNEILSSIPYNLIAGQKEDYYHTMVYLMLASSGTDVRTEVLSSRGRLDMAVLFKDRAFIIEFKCDESADKAIEQIKDKGYYRAYQGDYSTVRLLGINFDTKKREIDKWLVEEV